ncbi:B12-binding domain-containing radical SAM protein, partial [Candidatus Bathyarchaeota archaeon]|nr:B12-binding domain-containing radical SAM protein [Candidatus Bathyarchaeota archaeon]
LFEGSKNEELILSEKLKEIKGIAFKDNDKIFCNNLKPVMKKVVYDGFEPSVNSIKDYSLYQSARVYVETLRGCSNYYRENIENNAKCQDCNRCREGKLTERYYCPLGKPPGCGYCSVPSLYGPPKSRSVTKIVKEIKGLIETGVSRIVLSAPCILDYGRDILVEPEPLTNPRFPEPNYSELESLFSKITDLPIIKEKLASIMIENIKASLVTEKAAKLLGTYFHGMPISIGFETGSLEHSTQLGRPSTPNESLNAIKKLKKAGLKPYVYFIHGLPGQTTLTTKKTVYALNESIKNGAERIILYRFQSLPMSSFCNYPNGLPYVKDKNSKLIYDAALKANDYKKEDLKDQIIRVVVAEKYDRNPKYYVTYPLYHGPVVLVEGKVGLEGKVIDVKIIGKASDRTVYGQIDAMF